MQQIKHSIIMPTRNRAAGLVACIKNFIDELEDDTEIIIINDQSKDNTIEAVAQLQQEYSHKHIQFYTTESNHGPANARNYGASKAQGELILFMDDDTRVQHKDIRILIESMKTSKGIVVMGGCILNLNTGYISQCAHLLEFGGYTGTKNKIIRMVPSMFMLTKKNIFDKIGGFDTTLRTSEDADYCQRASAYGTIFYNAKAFIKHDSFTQFIKVCKKQFRYGSIFHQARSANKDLPYRLPSSKRIMIIAFVPLSLVHSLKTILLPYTLQHPLLIFSAPIIISRRLCFWYGILTSSFKQQA